MKNVFQLDYLTIWMDRREQSQEMLHPCVREKGKNRSV